MNKEKTKILVFGSSPSSDVLLKYRGTILEQVKSLKYLGVTLSYNGSFSRAVEDLCHCSLKVLIQCPSELADSLLTSCAHYFQLWYIQPILEYGCEIWGVKQYQKLERVFLKFCKE